MENELDMINLYKYWPFEADWSRQTRRVFLCLKTSLQLFIFFSIILLPPSITMSNYKTRIPKGSWILVTGATGHIAAHTIKLFLDRGFKVRGTVRDVQAASWLTQDVFKLFVDSGDLELVHVPDFSVKNAFDEAIKGVSAIAHIATDLSFSHDPYKVIPPVVFAINSILEAASKEASIKSFVYTSSIAAAISINPGFTGHAGLDTWNDEAVQIAWAPPPYTPERAHAVYQASKVETEKALWAFAEKRKPHFAINVVSPSTTLGEGLNKRHVLFPYPWIKNLYEGTVDVGASFQAGKPT
jgi:nucleoside-diphosphate-sugar epimerase